MNKVILMGRLTRDPEVRYSQGERSMAIARYTLAVDRRGRRSQSQDGSEQTADFIPCVAFDRAGEFAEKYFRQGMRVLVSGRIQTGSYTNRDGQKVYTPEVIVDDQEFADSSRFGCQDCYSVFDLLMSDNIKKLQGGDAHVGKRPKYQKMQPATAVLEKDEEPSKRSVKEQIELLKAKLSTAVADEEYEQAAKYRDEIRELEKEENQDA